VAHPLHLGTVQERRQRGMLEPRPGTSFLRKSFPETAAITRRRDRKRTVAPSPAPCD
jgi:hypothetical protein